MSSSSRRSPRGLAARLARQVGQGLGQVAGAVESALGRSASAPNPGVLSRLPEVLKDLRSPHLPEAASLLADLVPRSFQTSQIVAAQLPALLHYDDTQILSLYHAVVVAVLAQEKEAGPLIARAVPEHLARVGTTDRRRFMSRILRGAYVDWNLALVLCEHLPELMAGLTDEALDTFLRRGFSLWRENNDKAMSFFRLESRLGQTEVEALRRSLPLSGVRRTLQLYAQAHGGAKVRVRSLEELPEGMKPSSRSSAFTDGRTIYLPVEAASFETHEENFRLFKAMTAIEAGRIEFGTFSLPALEQSAGSEPETVPFDARQPGATEAASHGARALREQLETLSHPGIAGDLFGVLETYRIEQRIRHEYPGLVQDLERLTREGMVNRPVAAELEPLPAVLELFAQRLWEGNPHLEPAPPRFEPLVERLLSLAGELSGVGATVRDSLERTRLGMSVLNGLLPAEPPGSPQREGSQSGDRSNRPDSQGSPQSASSAAPGQPRAQQDGAQRARQGNPDGYQPFEPLPHQGRMWLDLAQELEQRAEQEESEARAEEERLAALTGAKREHELESAGEGRTGGAPGPDEAGGDGPPLDAGEGEGERMNGAPGGRSEARVEPPRTVTVSYPEWDWQIEDYKDNWCLVQEERLAATVTSFAEETLASHGPIVSRLKRQFQKIRREELEKLRRMPEGDEIDIDAVIEAAVDLRMRRPPSERLYIQRQKRIRDVAVAFLVDMSSSTQQVVQASGKTILDIEKESLLLMAEALETLGDAYAIYGFSGYGRGRVSYYVAKEFEERYTADVRHRIGGMSGRLENRDGAAIRHTVKKLLAQPARVRLLILLSDGRPLDCGCRQYFERYAQEDTRMALREARRQRVHPFCITVDRQAQRYLSRMYGQVQYTIIDQVAALPQRLPNIYRRLTT